MLVGIVVTPSYKNQFPTRRKQPVSQSTRGRVDKMTAWRSFHNHGFVKRGARAENANESW